MSGEAQRSAAKGGGQGAGLDPTQASLAIPSRREDADDGGVGGGPVASDAATPTPAIAEMSPDSPVLAPPLRSCKPGALCQRYCEQLGGAPECGMGGGAQCACVCEERFKRGCNAQLRAVSECVGQGPSPDSALRGRLFEGCEETAVALELCEAQVRERLCGQQSPGRQLYGRGARLAFCEQAPGSVAACLCGCETSLAVPCESQLAVFARCVGDAPRFSCNAQGQVTSEKCIEDWQALTFCRESFP